MKPDKQLPRLVIFADARKNHVTEAVADFTGFVEGKARIVGSYGLDGGGEKTFSDSDLAIVFGGDGSIIAAARMVSSSSLPVVGVNLGKLGFLAEFSVEELKRCFDDIVSGRAPVEQRLMLQCAVFRDGTERFNSRAINDVVVTAGPPSRIIELKIRVDGQSVTDCIGDGLIVATPTGSTAYNLSAGGPILNGKVAGAVVTPICAHSLSFRPIVISAESTVEVVGVRLNAGTAVLIDGQVSTKLAAGDVIRVQRHTGKFLIVNNPLSSHWETLARKLNWAGKPKYKRL